MRIYCYTYLAARSRIADNFHVCAYDRILYTMIILILLLFFFYYCAVYVYNTTLLL